jgi:hypothetical protein
MTRKQFFILLGCLFSCVVVLLTLYASSPLSQDIYRASFNRKFAPEQAITRKNVLDLDESGFYIAGVTAEHIYLGRWTAPFQLLIANSQLTDKQQVKLQISHSKDIDITRGFKVKVDSPYFYITNGILPGIFRGNLNHWVAGRFMPDSAYFVDAVPTGPASFALRSHSIKSNQYELAKESKIDTPNFEFKYGLLKKQVDGLFCVEGALHYNQELRKLVYLYTYRNQYMVLDTNLNLVQQYHTIDTFSHATIKVANIESKNYSMLAAPPAQINNTSCVSGKYLFVQSNLLANNEDQKKFERSSIIDMYDLTRGYYLHSFYLSDFDRKKPGDFRILNNQLFALFDDHLVVYDLSTALFDSNQLSEK